MTAPRQVQRVDSRNPTYRDLAGDRVGGTLPSPPTERHSSRDQPVDRRERETFGLAVIPAEAPEDSHILRQLLLGVQSEAVFQGSIAAGRGHLWCLAARLPQPYRLAIIPGVGVVEVMQQAHRSRVFLHG